MTTMKRCLIVIAFIAGCTGQSDAPPAGDAAVADTQPVAPPTSEEWLVRPLENAPARFRPAGWSSETVLWGLVGSRVTNVNVDSGNAQTLSASAWSLHTAQNRVSWRNEGGTWLLGGDGQPARIAGAQPDSLTGFDGPPTVLWSSDGSGALLGWHGEGGSRFQLFRPGQPLQPIELRMPGYSGYSPVLWLDSARVLFQTVANGPLSGPPMHRESGWRSDLAVFDLRTGEFTRVTNVPDRIYLRAAGRSQNGVLVTEWDSVGIQGHWLYDTERWQRSALDLPKGRAFTSPAGAVVVYLDSPGDTVQAVLITGLKRTELGMAARDAEPVFSPSGRRGAIRAGSRVILFEAK